MEFHAMQDLARGVAEQYRNADVDRFGRAWDAQDLVLGFVGDVGDLAKLAQSKAGVRPHPDLDAALAHELADCLWSVMTIADAYGVDLEAAFQSTMGGLSTRLQDQRERAQRD